MKHLLALLILALPVAAQTPHYGTTAKTGAVIDNSLAASTKTSRQVSSDPGTCAAGEKVFNTTSNKEKVCGPANTWTIQDAASGGGSGVGAFYSSGPVTNVGSAGRIWAPMGITSTVQSTANWQRVAVRVPAACTLKNLRVDLGAAQGSGGSEQVWIYAGPTTPTATALTCTIATGSTSCSNTTDQPAVSDGDFIYVQDLNGSATANTYIMVSFQCN